jgi:hypothetical protein
VVDTRSHNERRRRATIAALIAVVAVAGCGGGGPGSRATTTSTSRQPPASQTTVPFGRSSLSFRRDRSRTAVGVGSDQSVCRLLHAGEVAREVASVSGRTPRLHVAENDSFELSICRYSGSGAIVRVTLDGAADATRRYFNMTAEGDQIPKLQRRAADFRLVWDVGDDDTYGGAGAFWLRSAHRLVAIHADRIARVVVDVAGSDDRRRLLLASRLGRRVLARSDR